MQIEPLIREYLARNVLFSGSGFEYADDTSFLDAGILDSMTILELVGWTEATFGIQIEIRDVTPDNFDSVNRLAQYVRAKQNSAAPVADTAKASGD